MGYMSTASSVKIIILCGLVIIIVLRGTIGIGSISRSQSEVENLAFNTNLVNNKSDPDSQNKSQVTPNEILFVNNQSDPSSPNESPIIPNKNHIDKNLFDSNNHNKSSIDSHNKSSINPNVPYTMGPKIDKWDTQRRKWLEKNTGFPNVVGGKARVFLVTGSPPNPCETPFGDHYLVKGLKNKIDYGRLHGIEIMHNMVYLDEEMTGFWSKLPLIRKLILSHPEVEWIWWLDSDAIITDMTFEIPLGNYQDYNLVIHGYPGLLEEKSWISLNTGSFLLRNCQWSLDLLDAWAPMGPKGPIRDEAGKLLAATLKGRPVFEADDQSALIYVLITQKGKWMEKVYVENSYYLHGFWLGLVDTFEELVGKYHPGLGDERWPFVTHFVGCKPCTSYRDYPFEKCFKGLERAFNFADDQVLKLYGLRHGSLLNPNVKRIRNETDKPH